MTHTAAMADNEGEFGDYVATEAPCRKCGQHHVRYRSWESSCGGWDDHQYRCHDCGHEWWVEGIDS
jgi:DNA-directed RNA polymerase subunit M/transcription elongation factor TFIIS